jgi:hypothetical protein
MNGRGNHSPRDRQRHDGRLETPGCAEAMSNHRFEGRDGQAPRAFPEDQADSSRLGAIVVRRGGAVGVDVVHLVGRHGCIGERAADRIADRESIRLRRRRMERLAGQAVPGDLCVHGRASAPRLIEVFEHHHRGSFTEIHACPAAIERAAWLRIHDFERVEAAEGEAGHRVGPSRHRGVDPAVANRVRGGADGHRARGACRDDAGAEAFEAEVGGDEVDRRARKMIPRV